MRRSNLGLGEGIPFERTRRITGYLVGSLERWNDAKKSEESDRIKHGMFSSNKGVTTDDVSTSPKDSLSFSIK